MTQPRLDSARRVHTVRNTSDNDVAWRTRADAIPMQLPHSGAAPAAVLQVRQAPEFSLFCLFTGLILPLGLLSRLYACPLSPFPSALVFDLRRTTHGTDRTSTPLLPICSSDAAATGSRIASQFRSLLYPFSQNGNRCSSYRL